MLVSGVKPSVGSNLGRKGIHIGGFEFRELAIAQQKLGELVALAGKLLEGVGIGGPISFLAGFAQRG